METFQTTYVSKAGEHIPVAISGTILWAEGREDGSVGFAKDLREILRICAEKPEFLSLIDGATQRALFGGKEVLEIGCGPLGLSVVSFSRHKDGLKRLVKAEQIGRAHV